MAFALILARWEVELWLAVINRRHVLANASTVPETFKEIIDPATYAKSVQYTLAKSRFGKIEDTCYKTMLLVVLFSGVLPWAFGMFTGWLGSSAWAMAAGLFVVGGTLSLTGLPFDWFADFRLEQRFGFNTTTQKTRWLDRLKGLLLASALVIHCWCSC